MFIKYFKIISGKSDSRYMAPSIYDVYYLNGDKSPYDISTLVSLFDGSNIIFCHFRSRETLVTYSTPPYIASITIDINGSKKPNTYGKDIFTFFVADNGTVYPKGSLGFGNYKKSFNIYENPAWYHWKTSTYVDFTCKLDKKSHGEGCAARVLEEEKMNY